MNFDLDDDQRDLAAAARDYLTSQASPADARAALDTGAPIAPGRDELVKSGFATITVPEADGGGGGSLLDLAVVAEQAGRVLAGPSLVTYARAAALLAGDSVRLAALAAGTLRIAVVDGTAPTLDAVGADTFLALRGDDLVIGAGRVETRDPIDPTRGLAPVTLDGDADVVAADARERWEHAERVARIILAAEGLGAASRSVELAVDYAKQRHAFGRAIGSYQAVKHSLVDAYVQVEQLRSLVWWSAWAADAAPEELPMAAAAAKAASAATLQQATETLIQVHGGIGFTWEHDAHLYWRRAKVDRLLLGDDIAAYDEVARLALAGGSAMSGTTMGEHHLALLNERSQELVADHDTLLFEGAWHTSGSLFERGRHVAGGLRELGVQPGDRVMVLMMNTPEVFVTYQAIWRAGAVVMPVIFLQTPPELRHILEDSGAVAAVVTPELLPLVQAASEGLDLRILVVGAEADAAPGTTPYAALEAAAPLAVEPRADDDLAALLYTGGTTGRAKGVMLTHQGLWHIGKGLHSVTLSMDTTRSLLPLPLSHAYGLIVAVSAMHSERESVSVLQRWFDAPTWCELVAEHRLETSPTVPSMLTMLMAQPLEDYDLSSLVSFGSGGAPLPPALRAEVEERLGVVILEGYGLTESSAVVSASTGEARRPPSVGKALPGVAIEIRSPDGTVLPAGEDGEVCVSGPGVMKGYWNSPELTASTIVDGWLHTGDVGHLDDDGYLYIVDRIKDLIIRGGFNVYPRDVEDALLTHPDVTSAAVVGRPDPERGEEVVAVVAVAPGSALTQDQLIDYAKGRLAAHKYPREIRIVDAVPLTSVGKTDRKAVRALVRG